MTKGMRTVRRIRILLACPSPAHIDRLVAGASDPEQIDVIGGLSLDSLAG